MMRIVFGSALFVGYQYIGIGRCDLWVSSSWLNNVANFVMLLLYLNLFYENLIVNKPIEGVSSIAGAVFTLIYWYAFVWMDEYQYICKGPKAILIGGSTMFLLFAINLVADIRSWSIASQQTRKNFQEEVE